MTSSASGSPGHGKRLVANKWRSRRGAFKRCMGVTYRKSADSFDLSDLDRAWVTSRPASGEIRHRVREYGFMKLLLVVLNVSYNVRRYDAQDHAREYDTRGEEPFEVEASGREYFL